MEIQVCGQLVNGEFIPAGTRGMESTEVKLVDINTLSTNKKIRLIGIGKNLYRLTLKSYKQVKKELNKRGLMYRVSV